MKLLPILAADELFDRLKLDPELLELRKLAGLDAAVFDYLIKQPLHRYAEWVQLAPASQSHHHSGPGGLLVHTLDVIAIALKKRRGIQLPFGGSIADISAQRHVWTFAVFAGCLLHDIGKLSSSTRLVLVQSDNAEVFYTPLGADILTLRNQKQLKGYRIEFVKCDYRYHAQLSLLHWQLIPATAQTWLVQAPHILSQLVNFCWGDRHESGTIGDIIEYADRESTARNLQHPSSERFSNQISAIDRYLSMLRHWIDTDAIKINANGGMAWVDEQGFIYFVCRPMAEKLIQSCNQQGLKSLPQNPLRIYDILQEHGYAIPTEDGKAIWPIRVKCEQYEHQFTCLKFEARKLTTPTKKLTPFNGEIVITDTVIPETEKLPQETVDTEKNTPEAVPEEKIITVETAINTKESETGITIETVRQQDTETKVQDTEAVEQPLILVNRSSHKADHKIEPEIKATYEATTTGGMPLKPLFDWDETDVAMRFINWLKRGLIEKTILINNPTAEVHIAEEGVFLLAPAIFKTFLIRHGHDPEKHKNLSKRIVRLKLNIRNGDANIWPYWVSSSNRKSKISGWLFPFNLFFENEYPIPSKNKYLIRSLEEAISGSGELK